MAASTTPAKAPSVVGKVPAKTQYYTTAAQAQSAIGRDEPGVGVRFQQGKGYYLGAALRVVIVYLNLASVRPVRVRSTGLTDTDLSG